MSLSPVASSIHPSAAKPASEAAEARGPDHDGDKDDSPAAVRPASGQPAPGGGIYL